MTLFRRCHFVSRARAARRALLVLALFVCACGDSPLAPERPALAELPGDLAAVTFEAEGALGTPYVMLELHGGGGFSGFVAVNGAGEVVWYHRTAGGPLGHTRRRNGNFVLLDTGRGLVEVTPAGVVVRELEQEALPGRHIHHDVTATPDNTLLFIAQQCELVSGGRVCGDAIWEWRPETGEATRRWSAFDQLDPVADAGERSTADDWVHANSVAVGPRGNVLLSMHFLNQVISIAPDFSRIEWRMGGTNATIPVDDPFSGQHTAQELRPDRILLFDNGFERVEERYSRAAEYELRGGSARLRWEWRPERDNWARIISGVRPMSNGNLLVGFGTPAGAAGGATGPIEVYEVTADGRVAWHLLVSGPVAAMYRATPLTRF